MKGVFRSTTNSSIPFLLLRTLALPSPPPFLLLQPHSRRRFPRRNPSIDDRPFLRHTASVPPMDSLIKSCGISEINRNEEKEQSQATQASECSSLSSDPPPQPPEKPEAGDCCGNGCFPCIWDLYYEELEAYTKSLEEYNDRVSSKQK